MPPDDHLAERFAARCNPPVAPGPIGTFLRGPEGTRRYRIVNIILTILGFALPAVTMLIWCILLGLMGPALM